MKELLGMVLGWVIVTVVAWLISLGVVGYVLADLNPLHWGIAERTAHLGIQLVLILSYAGYKFRSEKIVA